MKFRHILLGMAVNSAVVFGLHAQDSTEADTIIPGSPRACRQGIAEYRDSAIRIAKDAKVAVNNDTLKAGMALRAKACVDKFNVDTLPISELQDLGAMYVAANEPDGARRTYKRIIENKDFDNETRAEGVVLAIESFRRAHDADSGIVWAEEYLPIVDAIPNVPTQQFKARSAVVGFYLGRDIDDKLQPTAEQMYDLAKKMTANDQKGQAKDIARAISILASLHASNLRSDSAVALLQSSPKEFPAIKSLLNKTLEPSLLRYKMVGKKLPNLRADFWLGEAVKVPSTSPTLLMFTANWCPSCKKSYASVKELSELHRAAGLKTVLAVTLDQVFEGVDMAPKEEVAANEAYFRQKEELTFPIAIEENEETAGEKAPARNKDKLHVGGYPQFMVVDKNGIVRAIILGWDPYGNRERALTAALKQVME